MKRTLFCAALLAVLAGATPFLCLLPVFTPASAAAGPAPEDSASPPAASSAPVQEQPQTAAETPRPEPEPILLYDAAAGAVRTVPARDYLVGAAACEMPAAWPDDALLAQMVASHSYALYQRDHGGNGRGAYLTVNSAQCSGWTDAEVLKSRWGEEFDARYERLCALADKVLRDIVTWEGAPAAACYHAISTGRTEASQNVWVEALPYLQGVDSTWDKASEEYEVTVQYSSQQVYDALAANLGVTPEGAPSTWVGETTWDEAGYVQSIELGGAACSGAQVRGALGLRSACFAIAWGDGQFTVTTRGYGHGVGLSQYGAFAMATGGAGWRSILTYYFPGTDIEAIG